jgi:hypothetical protein
VDSTFEDPHLGGSHPVGDGCSTLLTFAPSFPTRPGPAARTPVWMLTGLLTASSALSGGARVRRLVSPVVRASSRGIVQRSPLRRIARQGVHSRKPPAGCPVACRLRDGNATSHPRSDLVVLHHLAGLLLPVGIRILQRISDPGVHHVSAGGGRSSDPCGPSGRALLRFPVVRSCPSKLSLRAQRRMLELALLPSAGGSSPRSPSPTRAFTDLLSLSPLPPTRSWEVAFPLSRRRPDLRAFLRARVRC